MKLSQFFFLVIVILTGCRDDDTRICAKYFQQKYLDANIEHHNLFKSGNHQDAIKVVSEIIENDPNNFIAINYLASYKYLLCKEYPCTPEQLKEVYDLNKRSIELCPYYGRGYHNTIETLAELSKTEYENDTELIELLEIYNSKGKKKSNLLTKGGEAMFRLGNIDKSLDYLNEAIALNSSEAMAYIFKAKCYSSKKEWDKSMNFLNIGLSLDSLSLGFHERGYVNKQLGNIEEAVNDYKIAISLYPDRVESFIGIGVIEVDRGNLEAACKWFREGRGLEGDNETIDFLIQKHCKE